MHWPSAFASGGELTPKDSNGKTKTADISYIDTWKAMEKLQQSGKAKAIGISNFSQDEIETLLKSATITPAAQYASLYPSCLQTHEV